MYITIKRGYKTLYLLPFAVGTLFFVGMPHLAEAQKGQTTEAYVGFEKLFLEAEQQKLMGNYAKAIPLYEKAMEEGYNDPAVWYNLARAYHQEKNLGEAVRYAQKAQTAAPENEWYARLLADLYDTQGKFEDAANVYETLIKKNNKESIFYLQKAYYLVQANKISDAIKVYDEHEKKFGVQEATSNKKHLLYLGIGDVKKAEKELQQLLKTYPSVTEHYLTMARFYQQMGNTTGLQDMYQKILALDPQNEEAILATKGGALATDKGNESGMLPLMRDPNISIDNKIKQLIPAVQAATDENSSTKAIALIPLTEALTVAHPYEAKAWAVYGDVLSIAGESDLAIEMFQKTTKLNPNVFPVWEHMLLLLDEKRDWKQLNTETERALEFFPNDWLVNFLYGSSQLEQGKFAMAKSSLEQASMMSAGMPILMQSNNYVQIGRAEAGLKKWPAAQKAFDQALKIAPDNILGMFFYYFAWEQQGGDTKTQRQVLLEKMQGLANRHPTTLTVQAHQYIENMQWASAKSLLTEVLNQPGKTQTIALALMGDCLWGMDDQAGAKKFWQQSIDQGNQDERIKQRL